MMGSEERKKRCGGTEADYITRDWDLRLEELKRVEGDNWEAFDVDHRGDNRVVTVVDKED